MTKIAEHLVDVCRLIERPTFGNGIFAILVFASFAYLSVTADIPPTWVNRGYAEGAFCFEVSA